MSAASFDYIDAIETALTDTVWARVRAYARRHCYDLERAGLAADPDVMTADAVSDTTLGRRVWKPEKCALHVHLCGVIRSRVSHQMARSLRVRYVPIGNPNDPDHDFDPVEIEVSKKADENPPALIAHRQYVARVVEALFEVARSKNDNEVLALLDAYGDGITERADVLERAGMSNKQYRNARLRMARMADKLPGELREAALSLGSEPSNE